MANSKKFKDMALGATMRDVIGIFLVLAFIGAMVALLWHEIPHNNEQLLSYMLGQLSGFVAGVVAYHYITKAGDKELEQLRSENTGKAFEALKAAATGSAPLEPDVTPKPGETAQAESEEPGK